MSVSSAVSFSVSSFLWLSAAAWAEETVGAHFRDPSEFRQVIDSRCSGCHDRERIEAALRRQEALEPLTRRMLEKGAALTEQDREVLGVFWGMPLKGGKSPLSE